MAKIIRDFIHDVWAADAAFEAWRQGRTRALPLQPLLAYSLLSGLVVVGGIVAWGLFH